MDITGLWMSMDSILIEVDLSPLEGVEVSTLEPVDDGHMKVEMKRTRRGWKAIVIARDFGTEYDYSAEAKSAREAFDALRGDLPVWLFGGKRPILP